MVAHGGWCGIDGRERGGRWKVRYINEQSKCEVWTGKCEVGLLKGKVRHMAARDAHPHLAIKQIQTTGIQVEQVLLGGC